MENFFNIFVELNRILFFLLMCKCLYIRFRCVTLCSVHVLLILLHLPTWPLSFLLTCQIMWFPKALLMCVWSPQKPRPVNTISVTCHSHRRIVSRLSCHRRISNSTLSEWICPIEENNISKKARNKCRRRSSRCGWKRM